MKKEIYVCDKCSNEIKYPNQGYICGTITYPELVHLCYDCGLSLTYWCKIFCIPIKHKRSFDDVSYKWTWHQIQFEDHQLKEFVEKVTNENSNFDV